MWTQNFSTFSIGVEELGKLYEYNNITYSHIQYLIVYFCNMKKGICTYSIVGKFGNDKVLQIKVLQIKVLQIKILKSSTKNIWMV